MLKDEIQEITMEINEKTGRNEDVIEAFMPYRPDIIVMNPPYVRQESIPKDLKEYYVDKYKLDKKSDLYAYFLFRALSLLSEKGITSVICSDKWLESEYGIKLQEKLKDKLIAIHGQRNRSFGADINTIIVVYGKEDRKDLINFTYFESYTNKEIRQNIKMEREKLTPGKWFYLKDGSDFFLEKILPKLNHKLKDFVEIKFGIKTGANDFFYMKDISHLYESDYLSNPKKFEEWGINFKTQKELEENGLIYIENEGGERFVIDKKDVKPLIRSPKQITNYQISKPITLCLYTQNPGKFTEKYIKWGEQQIVEVKNKNKKVKGYNNLETTKNRRPWYKLPDLKPANVILPGFMMERLFIPFSLEPVVCDATFYTTYYKNPEKLWLYLNSTIFLMTIELFCRRLGGAASEIKVEDYEEMPIPDLNSIKIEFDYQKLLKRKTLPYYEEVKQEDRKELDKAILKALGFENPDALLPELYASFLRLVEDRLIKADRPLRRENNDEDN